MYSKAEDENAGAFRISMEHFVQDLLAVVYIPQWPAAEVILSILARSLCGVLTSAHEQPRPLRTMSIKLLGLIAAMMKREAKRNAETELFKRPNVRVIMFATFFRQANCWSQTVRPGEGTRFAERKCFVHLLSRVVSKADGGM